MHLFCTSDTSKRPVQPNSATLLIFGYEIVSYDTLESGINIALRLLIFWLFFQGLRPYSGLHRAYLSSISMRYKWGYAYFFCQIFQGLRLFQTLEYSFFVFHKNTPMGVNKQLSLHISCQMTTIKSIIYQIVYLSGQLALCAYCLLCLSGLNLFMFGFGGATYTVH